MPRDPEVLGQPTSPRSVSVARTTPATSRTCGHSTPGTGIEIDAHLVGVIEVLGAHRVRMQLEARQVGHPDQRGGITRHDFLGRAAGRKRQLDHLDPRRPRLGGALLVERLVVDAVGESQQHVRPPARPAQRAVGHRDVVAGEIQLGVAGLRERGPSADSTPAPRGRRRSGSRVPGALTPLPDCRRREWPGFCSTEGMAGRARSSWRCAALATVALARGVRGADRRRADGHRAARRRSTASRRTR